MRIAVLIVLTTVLATPASAQDTALHDPSISRDAQDGVIRLYGAGGPHTAIRKVADIWTKETGRKVEITAGPEKTWSKKAQADADVIWGTSEQAMTAFLETYKGFSSDQVEPIYLRPAVIAVKAGNPKGITKFEDLLAAETKIVVTEGAGIANTSGTGVWEDIAGRLGRLEDVAAFRRNIVAFEQGSGASFKAFKALDADAWITWPNWPISNPETLEAVTLASDRAIWRDLSVALAPDADPEAEAFLDYLISDEAQKIMSREGWVR
ncbi:accessory colonization factor [Mesorhizobium plurifarium]|uniref:substrate-binding domain-containing protein n=1 Tax=Sinorhizobium arboris TaxID=76745 RepID=UPI00040C31E2|nr:substrate-binding domain-containing protein [Sinorhizobium arboris]PST27190.1 accessory colonization factor [Mesorhizobium plurifarium]